MKEVRYEGFSILHAHDTGYFTSLGYMYNRETYSSPRLLRMYNIPVDPQYLGMLVKEDRWKSVVVCESLDGQAR
jgi:hypothetical protein